jgi:hypothetical protein
MIPIMMTTDWSCPGLVGSQVHTKSGGVHGTGSTPTVMFSGPVGATELAAQIDPEEFREVIGPIC